MLFFPPLLQHHVSKVREGAGDILCVMMKSVLLDKMQRLLQAHYRGVKMMVQLCFLGYFG